MFYDLTDEEWPLKLVKHNSNEQPWVIPEFLGLIIFIMTIRQEFKKLRKQADRDKKKQTLNSELWIIYLTVYIYIFVTIIQYSIIQYNLWVFLYSSLVKETPIKVR